MKLNVQLPEHDVWIAWDDEFHMLPLQPLHSTATPKQLAPLPRQVHYPPLQPVQPPDHGHYTQPLRPINTKTNHDREDGQPSSDGGFLPCNPMPASVWGFNGGDLPTTRPRCPAWRLVSGRAAIPPRQLPIQSICGGCSLIAPPSWRLRRP